jgi:hypothetical protein
VIHVEIKKPATFDQQIEKLINRGCAIGDPNLCKNTLHRINYYRLSAYFLPFKVGDKYLESTKLVRDIARVTRKNPPSRFPEKEDFLQFIRFRGIVDNPEPNKHRQQDVQQPIYCRPNIYARKFLDAEHGQRGNGQPQSPRLEAILHDYSPFSKSEIR